MKATDEILLWVTLWDQTPAKYIVATDQKIISVIQKCKNTCKKCILHKLKKMQNHHET